MKTRFAPSPTGYLHLGHAYAALTAYAAARDAGSVFVLRMENIDQSRCRVEYEQAIYEDLAWLGIEWELPVRRQSDHFGDYAAALQTLQELGVLYPCFCTRKDIAAEINRAVDAPHGPEGPLYPGTCRTLHSQRQASRMKESGYALRLDVVNAMAQLGKSIDFEERGRGPSGETGRRPVQPELLGDVVLARKDFPASYHLAVVVDDALQGIELVTRGADLYHATHVQRLLQQLLELPAPCYAHHSLILDESGKKFSKRDRAATLRSLRASGVTPEDIRRYLGLSKS